MGQSNSEIIESRTILIQNWQTKENEPNLLVNRITHEQVQKHIIHILIKDLPRQTALFASRMSSHQPFVCRLLYFHPAVPDSTSPQESQKDFREMFLYTDRMLPLKDWNLQKLKTAIQGFKRIISVNGPIKVTQNMICENQKGETKIWMSQNPVNNHPCQKYMSQQQTVADIATILTKKNKDIAGRLMGCHTLRDILQKLNQTARENSSPYQNYSHRASQSGDLYIKKNYYLERGPDNVAYRNVFGEPIDKREKNHGFLTPKPANKNYEKYPQSAFSRIEQQNKPKSNFVYFQKFLQQTKNNQRYQIIKEEKNEQTPILSRKVTVENSLGQKINTVALDQQKNEVYNSKIQKKTMELKKKSQKLIQVSYFSNLQPHNNFHRFQTTKLGSTDNLFAPKFTSVKTLISDQWKNNQSKNLKPQADIKQNNFYDSSAANFINNKEIKRGQNITIINNNVNNYINNITHNHVMKVDQFRSPKVNQNPSQTDQKVKFSNKKPNNNINFKQKTDFIPVPVFIQQKKRMQNNLETGSPINSNIPLNHYEFKKQKRAVTKQAQQHPNKLLTRSPLKNEAYFDIQKSTYKSPKITNQFSFSPLNNGMQSPVHPKTPTIGTRFGNNFSSFIKVNNSGFQLKSGLRTKTTESYTRRKDINKNEISIQNKSFTQNQKNQAQTDNLQQFIIVNKVQSAKIFQEIIQPKPKLKISSEKIVPKAEPAPEEKQNFKKQLRNQLNFLLGGEPPKEQSKTELTQNKKQKLQIQRIKQAKQVEVKDKIIKKQMQFAQLKKQALKVLIDL